MHVDFCLFNARYRLYRREKLVLDFLRHGYDAAAVADIDDHVDNDRIVLKIDLYALAYRLDPDQLGELGSGRVGQAGYALTSSEILMLPFSSWQVM